MNKLIAQWRAIDWKLIVPNVLVQMIIWSYVPLSYAVGISTTSFKIHLAPLFLYQLLASFTIVMMYEHHLRSTLNLPVLIATIALSLSGLWHGNIMLVGLLLLFPIAMLLVQLGLLDNPPETGLVAYAITYCFSIPIVMVRLTTGFISGSYIEALFPMLAIVLFFQTTAFLPDSDYRPIVQTVTGILAVILLCLRSLKLTTIIAIVLLVLSWVVMQQRDDLDHQMSLVSFAEMIVIILAYWN